MSAKRILIMGLATSGKSTLSQSIIRLLTNSGKTVEWFNADIVRTIYRDWDFSKEGRIRQATRMAEMANRCEADYVIADFIAPLQKMRDIFNPNYIIWMDTIKESKYPDTDKVFESPKIFNFKVTTKDAEKWASIIVGDLL